MGIGLEHFNFDEPFKDCHDPIIVNDIPVLGADERAVADGYIGRVYKGERFSTLPTCSPECELTSGTFRIGHKCLHCGTTVQDHTKGVIKSRLWVRQPQGVEKLISPIALLRLDNVLRYNRDFSWMQWALDCNYRGGAKYAQLQLHKLLDMGIRRDYNYFIKNMEYVLMQIWHHICYIRGEDPERAKAGTGILAEAYDTILLTIEEKDKILNQYIGLPNAIMTAMEVTSMGTYVDPTIQPLMLAYKSIRGVETETIDIGFGRKATARVVAMLFHLVNYYRPVFEDVLGGKPGAFRRTIYGMRTTYSIRAVITAITGPHEYDVLQLPWCAVVVTWSVHIANKLYARGFGSKQIMRKLHQAHYSVDPDVKQALDDIWAEAGGYFYCYWNRNPSLVRGSYMLMRAVFKTDVNDKSIGNPNTNIAAANSDFDGDQMTCTVLLDKTMIKLSKGLTPVNSIGNPLANRSLGAQIELPRPTVITMGHWFNAGGKESVSQDQLDFTNALQQL